MVAKIIDKISGTATTTDGTTVTTVCTFTMSPNTNMLIGASLVGRDTSNGDIATAKTSHRSKRVAGTASLIGSVVDTVSFTAGSDTALIGCALTIDTSGNDIRLRVTGVIAKTIDWLGELVVYVN